MKNELKNKAVSGVKWTSYFSIANAGLGIIYRLILVAILTPNEFAYIAVLSLFIGIANLFSNMGIGEAILQQDEVSNKQISSIYYFELILSILVGVVLFSLSPVIEQFYGYNNLTTLLRLTSFTLLLSGGSSLFRVLLQKNFLFKWVVVANLVKLISDMIITVFLIYMGFGIYGFVYGTLASTGIFLLLLGYYCFTKTDVKLLLHFNIQDIIPVLRFGFFISAKQIFAFVASRIDEVIIGAFLSAEVLGVYFFAKDFIKKPQNLITQSFSQVMLPLFSKVKHNIKKLSELYTNTSRYIGLIAFPVFAGIAVTADLYVPLLFGDHWSDAVFPIQIFSITGILLVLTANFSTSLLYALGKPNLTFYVEVVTNLAYFLLLGIVSRFGIYAIIFSYVIYIGLKTFTLQLLVGRELNFSMVTYIKSMGKILIATVLMTLVVWMSMEILIFLNPWFNLILSILIGVLFYIIILYKIEKELFRETLSLIKSK